MLQVLKTPGDCKTPEDWDRFIEPGWQILDMDQPGWHDLVDTDKLDMLSIYRCVLGQVYGDWGIGCDRLTRYATEFEDPSNMSVVQLAFAGLSTGPVQQAWVREIGRRRQVVA